MFSNFGYGRRPTTITTYKRKRNDPLPATLSDDDSDLDEPILSATTVTQSSPSVKLGNNKNGYDGFSTTTNIQHPISTFLDKQLEINARDIGGTLEEESLPQQQQVEIAQAPQPQQPISIRSSSPATRPVIQSSSVAEYQEQFASSFSVPSVENSSSTLDMDSLNILEPSQHIQQQYQTFGTSFQIPSQPLPPILDTPFDWMSLGNAFGQNVPLLPPVHEPLLLLPQQIQVQQQQGFSPTSSNEQAASNSAPRPTGCDNSFIHIQSSPLQSVVDTDILGNIAADNSDHTKKAKNVVPDVFVEPETVIASTTTSSLSPMRLSSSSSSFDIFEIPEIPTPSISARFVERQPSKDNSDTSFDVFDFPLENTTPKITKKYQSPTKRSSTVTTAATTTVVPAGPKTAKKDVKQTQFDIFDFPEEDDTNIVELKMISTQSPSFSPSSSSSPSSPPSHSSLPIRNSNESDKKSLKSDASRASSASTIAKEPPQLRQQQRRKPLPLKKSKSDTPSSSGRRVRFAPEILVSTFYRTSLDRSQPFSAPTFSEEIVKETEECLFSVPSPPRPLPQQQQQLPIKRKRNLVSQLRGATGAVSIQTSNCPSLRKYNFDEDEDDNDVGEEENVTGTSKMMDEDEQEYRERMERELVAIMENEFGREEQQEKEKEEQENSSSRPQYRPKNAMNVRVTYKSSKRQHHVQQNDQGQHGQDREMIELDNLLDKLRAGSTDL